MACGGPILLLNALLCGASPTPAPVRQAAFVPPPILMYHRVDVDNPRDRVGRELTISPEQFTDQLAYLQHQGWHGISMAQMRACLHAGKPLDRMVVLTFDDGYEDQYRYALPILQHFGDSATFYVITGMVGTRHHLQWSEIAAMSAQGQDIAAHGVMHNDLSKMSSQQQAFQIDDSVRTLRVRLHAPIESYAYPSGRFNRTTLTLVRQSGVDFAVTTDARYVLAPQSRYELTRVRVRSDWGIGQFGAALRRAVHVTRAVSITAFARLRTFCCAAPVS